MRESNKRILVNAGFNDAQIEALNIVFTEQPEKADFWDSVKYFSKKEFACKCGGRYCNGYPAPISENLMRVLDTIREMAGTKCIISSGLRCDTHNRNVGGVPNSWHRQGKAADFALVGKSAKETIKYAEEFSALIIELYAIDNSYVHMAVK